MDMSQALSVWVNSQIRKTRGAKYRTNEEFATAFDISEPTVRRLRRGQKVHQSTLEKLATGSDLDFAAFVRMISEFSTNPNDKNWLITQIEGGLTELSPDEMRSVQALIDSFIGNKKQP